MSIVSRFVLALVLCASLFLCPVRVYGQSYTGTASAMSYGMYNGTNHLVIFSEWFYSSGGSGSYQWSGDVVRFDVTITKYTSQANYNSNNPVSTNTTTVVCASGEWMVQQWNQTTVRVSGTKYLSLDEGYISVVTINPHAHGSYKPSYYAQWSSFQWNGQQQTDTFDLLHPGDD